MSTEKSETNLLSLLEVAKATWPRMEKIGNGATFHDWCQTIYEAETLGQLRVITCDKQFLGIIVASNDQDGTLTVKEMVCLAPGVAQIIVDKLEDLFGQINTLNVRRHGRRKRINYKVFKSKLCKDL